VSQLAQLLNVHKTSIRRTRQHTQSMGAAGGVYKK